MKILVTGAGGFLGSQLIQKLSDSNFQVTGATTNAELHQTFNGNFELKTIEWHDKKSLLELCSNKDLVIHAAGMNHRECELNPQAAREFNGEATANLIDSAIRKSVKNFIYISTVHVYSDALEGVFTELSPTRATSSYATSHLLGENAVLSRARENLISGKVIRLGNTFGRSVLSDDQNIDSTFISNCCKSIANQRRFVVNNNPNIERDFVPIGYFLEQMIRIILNYSRIEQEVINLVTSKSFSLNGITELIKKQFGKERLLKKQPEIVFTSEKREVLHLNILNTNQNILNQVTPDSFETEIMNLIKYFEKVAFHEV